MADGTHIEWADATWNPIIGCSVVSPGCANCYAMRLAGGRLSRHPSRAGLTHPSAAGPVWTGEVRLWKPAFRDDFLFSKRPRRIFVCAHGDLFHERVPDEWIDRVFAVMGLAPQHTFLVLTKRAERMREYATSRPRDSVYPAWPLPNIWLGVSVEDQRRADERIPELLATPAAVHWISAEPLLGPVDLRRLHFGDDIIADGLTADHWQESVGIHGRLITSSVDGPTESVDWVVCGGESGRGARPMHIEWARSIIAQCKAAGVSCFVKQLGTNPETSEGLSDGSRALPVKDRKGGDWSEWPEDLRVRAYPR